MEIVTSWMEKGLKQGLEQGMEQGLEQGLKQGQRQEARALVLRQLRKRLGDLDSEPEARIEALSTARLEELGEALLDFRDPEDLTLWLQAHAG